MRIATTKASGPISRREAFQTHGALRGEVYRSDEYPTIGWDWLPREWAEAFKRDRDNPGIVYVVWSYSTPIAWERADGVVVVPGVSYSVTTSKHQGKANALGVRAVRVIAEISEHEISEHEGVTQ